ncbi:MAG: hypothetical protein K2P81_08030 [Bacteriovoracaceae bacterium]|nr:hypothetical protein [Bacteriovoracaceae bacterium]
MAKTKPKTKIKATKPAAKKPAAKGKPVAKAKPKAKPAAKKAAPKKAAPAPKKGLLKTAGKIAGKAIAALSKVDKEKAKKEALKAKAEAAKEKERLKKEAAKEKLEAAKEKEKAKKAAAAEKMAAQKAKEQAKKDAEKAKVLAAKEAEKAKKEAAKEAEKAAKLKAKEDEKAAKMKAKEDAKKRARGEDVEDEESAPRAAKGDDDDDEEDFKRVAAKGKTKGKSKYDEEGTHDLERGYKKFSVNDLEGKIADEIAELREHFAWKDIVGAIGTLDFFVDPKDDSCVEKGCDNIRTTQSWCRLHYLKNWKGIQTKKEILSEGKLQEYIEELISKYPAKYIEAITNDLSDDKEFYKVLNELNITNDFDFEEEDFEQDNDDDSGDDIGIEATFTGSMRYEDTE